MKPFRVLTVAAFAAAIGPRLAHRGMFVDGVTYAAIARNLAEGRGTFWTPFYTTTIYPRFHDHPPLALWLESLWFRLLGDHLFVERVYSLTAAVATAALIALLWRRLHAKQADPPADAAVTRQMPPAAAAPRRDSGPARDLQAAALARYEWLPVLLWIAAPVVSWSIVGNLLETTMALFTTAATLTALAGVTAAGRRRAVVWGVASGLCVVAAALAKGPVGLFPLMAPSLFFFLPGSRRAWTTLAAQWSTVAACTAVLLAWSVARASLVEYVQVQVLAAIGGRREASAGSFTIVIELLQGVVLPMAGVGLLAVGAARRYMLPAARARRQGGCFLLLGLAGTLPILLSVKQAGHYLVPAVPLFALAGAIGLAPTLALVVERWTHARRMWLNAVSAVVILAAIGGMYAPAIGRDRDRLANLDELAAQMPRDTTLGICPDSNGDWGLHAWFERRFNVGLDAGGGDDREWFLKTKQGAGPCVPARCAAISSSDRDLVLMKCARRE